MNSAYISGALMGAGDLAYVRGLYEAFAQACEAAGVRAYLPHQNTDPDIQWDLADDEVTTKDLNELSNADVIVAYLGEPSLGVGAELVIAMQQNKTILAVYECRRKISRFVRGLLRSYENASLYEFASPSEACGWITDTLLARRIGHGQKCKIAS
jgi:nucleoside 2-deoxyribosyltransferase